MSNGQDLLWSDRRGTRVHLLRHLQELLTFRTGGLIGGLPILGGLDQEMALLSQFDTSARRNDVSGNGGVRC